MKKLFTPSLLLGTLCLLHQASAADLTVGPGGTYSTISAAITAAADGDRILVKPKAVPYGETLTITKTLTFASADEGTTFKCIGDWTFNPSSAQKRLTVIGIDLTGTITTGIQGPGVGRSQVQVMGSVIHGDITFNANNYYLTVAADSVYGGVYFRAGKVIGNYFDGRNSNQVIYTTSEGVTPENDSIWVVGNKIWGNNTNAHSNVELTTAQHYVYCSNNYLILNGNTNKFNYGFYMNAQRAAVSGAGMNTMSNNTVLDLGNQNFGSSRYAMSVYSPLNNTSIVANLVVSNNANGNGNNAFLQQAGGVNNFTLAYNILRGYAFSTSVPSNGTNKTTSTATVTQATGAAGGDAVDGGPTDPEYTDLDLTRGDVGAFGGSFSLANFHPFTSSTASNNQGGRVYLLRAPRTIQQGGSIQVKAEGFDR